MDPAFRERFAADLGALIAPGVRLGVAVSGGPDSLALLLLANAVRPGCIEAATIDHRFREGSREEAETVAALCAQLGVPHAILTARWEDLPASAIQERARKERYRLLAYWAEERRLGALATAHHAEDQAETLLMRLARGSGVKGLAAMRRKSVTPGAHLRLARPLLDWRHAELEQVCAQAGVVPARDPSNADERFERVRVRQMLRDEDWIDPAAVAHSAANLAAADDALDWAATMEWKSRVAERHGAYSYCPEDVPAEVVRRVILRALRKLGTEGDRDVRGPELDRLVAALREGGTATLRGVLCRGGKEWRFTRAPARS
jgi:tRNA(Ile)-lysidine synthase